MTTDGRMNVSKNLSLFSYITRHLTLVQRPSDGKASVSDILMVLIVLMAPNYWNLDVGDLAFMSLIKVGEMRKEGVLANLHSLARAGQHHVTCGGALRL